MCGRNMFLPAETQPCNQTSVTVIALAATFSTHWSLSVMYLGNPESQYKVALVNTRCTSVVVDSVLRDTVNLMEPLEASFDYLLSYLL